LIRDGQHAARDVAVFRPQMKQRFAAFASHFQSGEMAVMRLPFLRISMVAQQGIPAAPKRFGKVHFLIIN